MKNKKRKIGILIGSILVLLIIVGCVDQPEQKEKTLVKTKPIEKSMQIKEIVEPVETNETNAISKKTINQTDSEDVFELANVVREMQKRVELVIEKVKETNNEITVKIVLKNPQETEINSVRSFISYNPKVLKGKEINFPESSPFTLIAPNESTFYNERGLVAIGISVAKKPTKLKKINIAEITFERLSDEIVTLDFFDAQDEGHTKVLSIFNNQTNNILIPPKTPAIIFETKKQK